jgi:Flp pilus assembly protein TadG
MACALTTLAARLLRDERGTSVIELSFIIPVLIMLICGASDLAMCYARGLTIQQAAARTAELALASGAPSDPSVMATTLQNEAATAAGITVSTTTDATNCQSSSNPCVKFWLECDGVVQLSYTSTCTGSAVPGRFVSITLTDTYNWMFEQIVPSWNHQPYSVQLRGFSEVRLQ